MQMRLRGMHITTYLIIILVIIGITGMGFGLTGCDEDGNNNEERKVQEDNLESAMAQYPPYQYQNFLTRQAVNEYCERTDTPNKLWYVYLYGPMGQELGYFTVDKIPTSINIAMTSPEKLVRSDDVVMKAPALDGVYYAGAIDMMYMFDVATGAMICYYNLSAVVCDQPLSFDAPQITVVMDRLTE